VQIVSQSFGEKNVNKVLSESIVAAFFSGIEWVEISWDLPYSLLKKLFFG
jgi:hypothetical protein